jgi:DNA-binding CsgD family transcriptional regulator/energy-coupling factor transporter ATP-binding protein EcfA2
VTHTAAAHPHRDESTRTMTLLSSATAPSGVRERSYVWERQTRPAVEAIAARGEDSTRALLVGSAGSGKSMTLRRLHRLLLERKRDASLVTHDVDSIEAVPRSHVMLVDDLHLMSRAQVDLVLARSEDPDTALVVASRPWPSSEAHSAIARRLEQTRPAIVLGHVSRSDVLTYLEGIDRAVSSRCVEHILLATGGVSWLVTEALLAHDERDCAGDHAHGELRRALEERIAHRLDTIDPALRHVIEELCVAPPGRAQSLPVSTDGDVVMQGYAEGLLMRNGQPVPLVRSAVHATIPVHRLIDLSTELAESLAHSAATGDATYRDWVGLVHDQRVGDALVRHADRMLEANPRRAIELYRGAIESGIDPSSFTGRQAQAAWASGDLDAASTLLDSASARARALDADRIADTAAASWAARGMMEQGCSVYRAAPPTSPDSLARAAIAELGMGRWDGLLPGMDAGATVSAAPSALGVSMQLLRRGLGTSVSEQCSETVLIDLVRASEMYTSARTSGAIPELPAVIATIAALSLGDLYTAHTVIDDAVSGGHGGPWAARRLLLWRAWVAVQRNRPAEAREALGQALECASKPSPRDVLLAEAVRVAIARRYEDAAGLEAAWRHARGSLLRTDMDLYLILPLAELMSAAARIGETERVRPHAVRALEITERLGGPALWSVHLHWAAIQQGILLSRPEDLPPHAHALVAASSHSRIAATMARAGRIWTSVLAGSVDADAVESAARGLGSIGLAWDGARLAGHGAGRTDDRKVAARLLACARELHPADGTRKTIAAAEDDAASGGSRTPPEEVLSERELEVARLVLQGKTYAEIGAAIFISPRTAEHHIAHIRRRLGAASRSDMIAKLRLLVGESVRSEEPAHRRSGGADGPP